MYRPKTPVRILFSLCATGNEPAWREFLQRFGPTVRRAIEQVFGRRCCPSGLEDSTQDVYYALLADNGRRLRAFRGTSECQASGFLARTAERLARDSARVARRHGGMLWQTPRFRYLPPAETLVDPGPGPEARFLGTERRQIFVSGCRGVLQEAGAARAVELAIFDGWASRELARASRGRFTSGAIDTLLSRARQRLAPHGLRLPHRIGFRATGLRRDV